MQTFLPAGADLELGFERLDRQRLGKQRVETFQILNVLRGIDKVGLTIRVQSCGVGTLTS